MWSLSDNFTKITLKSSAIAINIFLRLQISLCSHLYLTFESFDNHSHKKATSEPNSASISSFVFGVSSITSCIRQDWIVKISGFKSSKIIVASTGCIIYGSQESLNCHWCASFA